MIKKTFKKSLFIFRRDLRLEDNTALIEALKSSNEVICAFIFTPTQVEKNEFKSENGLQFLIQSLKEVHEELTKKQSRLYLFYGENAEVIPKIVQEEDIEAIFVNRDVTPFSRKRDELIQEFCENNDISFNAHDDIMFNHPNAVLKDDGKPYTVFTPFYKKAIQTPVKEPQKNTFSNYYQKPIDSSVDLEKTFAKVLPTQNENILTKGGRKEAFEILKERERNLHRYHDFRDYPFVKGTTTLSAHNKFGTLSVRELYFHIKQHINDNEHLIREVYWRDFYLYIAYHFPHVFGEEFQEKFKDVQWDDNEEWFQAWCEGKTGFPIVDAGMRELNETGYMHNRVRMIVASFLTKDLHINWRKGEKYFAHKLTDYDPAVNNGSWQWAASTGCDAQPYFRVFNPWLQQKKFDEKAEYIKKWIPELKDVDPKAIHNLDSTRPLTLLNDYPRPIVDHSEERQKAIAYYKHVS